MKEKKLTLRFHDGTERTIIVKQPECIQKKKVNKPRMPHAKHKGCKTNTFYISKTWLGEKAWKKILNQFGISEDVNEATLEVIHAHFKKEPPDMPEINFHHCQAELGNFYPCPSPYKETMEEILMKVAVDELKDAYDEGYKMGMQELNNELLRLGLLKKPDWIEGELSK